MYDNKKKSYFSYCRTDLLKFVPRNKKNRMLEIGAGSGETLLKAKEMGLAEKIVGIELQPIENSNQSHPKMDRFIIGDIESMELDLGENYFDVILCGDVLEHLVDPWNTVRKLSKYLKDQGIFIASIPNVREISNLMRIIIRGDFQYADTGVMDKTHLRFFCKKNIIGLFEKNSLEVVSISSNFDDVHKGKKAMLNKLSFNFFYDFFVEQYYVVARKYR
jgi:2-polyprenyl-3-methyl-5-hydroxy-6-metoxy-1,4-benzoquinol methylase